MSCFFQVFRMQKVIFGPGFAPCRFLRLPMPWGPKHSNLRCSAPAIRRQHEALLGLILSLCTIRE